MADTRELLRGKKVAILVPCYNEEVTVGKVVADFKASLPEADVYVYDNVSTDRTALVAAGAGAIVGREPRKGKGFVVRRMFREIDADYYVMADGDDTYPAECVLDVLKPVVSGETPMSVGARLATFSGDSFRPMHVMGNKLIRGMINKFFGAKLTDVLSGYRAFDRDTVKSLPLSAKGFEVEVEMTIEVLEKGYLPIEVQVPYRGRPVGSVSKLSTFRDGMLVVTTILRILKDYRPLFFFGTLAGVSLFLGLLFGSLPIYEFMTMGAVYRVPTAFMAASLVVLSMVSMTAGLILDSLKRRHNEICLLLGEIRGLRKGPGA